MPKRRKIILVNILEKRHEHKSLALGYLKAYADSQLELKAKTDIILKEYSCDMGEENILEDLTKEHPSIVGFSCFLWNISVVISLCHKLKNRNPQIITLLGGVEVTPRYSEILSENPAVDVIVRGEGELVFADFLTSWLKEGSFDGISGLAFRRNGKIATNPMRMPPRDPNILPSPYLTRTLELQAGGKVLIETLRGCPFRCGFCTWASDFRAQRFFSDERVLSEIKFVLDQIKFGEIYIIDSDFFLNKQRAKHLLSALAGLMKRRKDYQIKWLFESRLSYWDKEMSSLIDQLGMIEISVGIQSTNPHALVVMKRGFNRRKVEDNIARLRNSISRLNLATELIVGLPGDSLEGYRRSLNWALSILDQTNLNIFKLLMLPGSQFRKNANAHGIDYNITPPYEIGSNNTFPQRQMDHAVRLSQWIGHLQSYRSIVEILWMLGNALKGHAQLPYLEAYEGLITILKRRLSIPENKEFSFGYARCRDGKNLWSLDHRSLLLNQLFIYLFRRGLEDKPAWTELKRKVELAYNNLLWQKAVETGMVKKYIQQMRISSRDSQLLIICPEEYSNESGYLLRREGITFLKVEGETDGDQWHLYPSKLRQKFYICPAKRKINFDTVFVLNILNQFSSIQQKTVLQKLGSQLRLNTQLFIFDNFHQGFMGLKDLVETGWRIKKELKMDIRFSNSFKGQHYWKPVCLKLEKIS